MSLVECPTCHARVEPGSAVCPLCRAALERPDLLDAPAPSGAPVELPPPFPPTFSPPFSPPFPPAVPPTSPLPRLEPTAARRRRRWPVVLAAVLVLAVAGGAVGWYAIRNDDRLGSEWASATTASGRYTVDMPGPVRRISETVPISIVDAPVEVMSVGDGGLDRLAEGALFIEADMSSQAGLLSAAAGSSQIRVLLRAQARSVVEAAGVSFGSSEDVDSPLGPAVEVTGSVDDRNLAVRGFLGLQGTNVVGVVAIAADGDDGRAEAVLDRIVGSILVN